MSGPDRLVTVCDRCLTAACWHGEFFCDGYLDAGITRRSAAALDALGLEDPGNYSPEKILEVQGLGLHEPDGKANQ